MSERQAIRRLAERMVGRPDAVRSGPSLTGTSTPGASTTEETDRFGIPLPIGDVGDVITATINGDGDKVASWEAPTGGGGASGRYRSLLYALDGSGGFDFLVDEDGHPMYVLEELE